MKNKYFKTIEEAMQFAEKNNMSRNTAIDEDSKAYMSQYSEIDGCEVVVAYVGRAAWRECIVWKGVLMYACTPQYNYGKYPKTFEIGLVEPMDWQGVRESGHGELEGKPQFVGKPTAKKLDNWREWLLANRKYLEGERDRTFAMMVAKIEQVKEMFPEAKQVKWENGYWNFENTCNGLTYYCNISQNGDTKEDLKLAYDNDHYVTDKCELAARMMKNNMEGVERIEDDAERPYYVVKAEMWKERVSKYMGGRPNF